MANYHSLKNAAIAAPTATPDLGSDTNRYGNVYMSGNINMSGTSLTSTNVITPKVASIAYAGSDDTAADITGGQIITLNGTGFTDGASILIAGTVVSVVAFVNSTQLTFVSPAMATGSYVIYVVNPDGGTALSIPGIQYSGTPAWSTGAGTLGTSMQGTSVSITVAATGDAPVTYSLYSGALPSGVTLNTGTGVISGTAPAVSVNTTYNFVVRASDAQKQDTNRSFSLTISAANNPTTVEYLLVAGGGGGGGSGKGRGCAGGGGAGGYLNSTLTVNPSSAITITVGAAGAAGTSNSTDPYETIGGNGGSSVIVGASTITAIGGGGGGILTGGATGGTYNGQNGGSGGGGGWVNQSLGGNGTAGQGNNGITTIASLYAGGGGGGAASVGSAQNGGAGSQNSISGAALYYAGGGGGGGSPSAYGGGMGPGTGGDGGGGAGGLGAATAGSSNTGGGGGGGGGNSNMLAPGGAGGSGIAIIRYADTYDAASATTGSPTITVAGGYRVYKFTSSGTITF